MAIFGLGGSSSKSRSFSESYGYDIGGQYAQSYLDPQMAANYQGLVDMYNSPNAQFALRNPPGLAFAQQQAYSGLSGVANMNTALGNQFNRQGGNYAGQLAGQAANAAQMAQGAGMAADYGRQMLGQFAQQDNPYLNQQIAGIGEDIGRQFREQILPGLRSQSAVAGQRGGSRGEISQGLAAQGAIDTLGQQSNALRLGAYGQQQNAAQSLAALGQQQQLGLQSLAQHGYGQAAGMAYGQSGDAFQRALQAMGMRGQQGAQFAGLGMQAGMNPFIIGSQIIGMPQVLSQSMGFDYGYDYSKSKSKGTSQSLDVGFGKK